MVLPGGTCACARFSPALPQFRTAVAPSGSPTLVASGSPVQAAKSAGRLGELAKNGLSGLAAHKWLRGSEAGPCPTGDGRVRVERRSERWPVVRLALSETGRASGRALRRLVLSPRLREPRPDRLLFAPQDLRTADPTVAADFSDGLYPLAGRTVRGRGASPFGAEPPTEAWAAELYGFGWLRHLRAAETPGARETARRLVADALGPSRRTLETGIGRRTPVMARRLISLLAHSPLVLSGAEPALYVRCLEAIGRWCGSLERDMARSGPPADRLQAAIAVSFAGLCCAGLERPLRRGLRVFEAELDRQILPDGGHVSRNPAVLIDLAADLLPLRLLFASRALAVPTALSGALDRLTPMLRFFRHGSGDFALFNGMGATPVDLVATLLGHDRDGGEPVSHALPSGYDRLVAGGAVVLAETGPPPPPVAAGSAAAGCLSFEFSSGPCRVVVNCGAPPPGSRFALPSRRTAAHSTVTLDGRSSAVFLPEADDGRGWAGTAVTRRLGPILLAGPTAVTTDRQATANGGRGLKASHDGYRERFGAVHERELFLAGDGALLAGLDTIRRDDARTAEPVAAAVRFHLAPDVEAEAEPGSAEVRIRLPNAEHWLFTAPDVPPAVEASVSFAVPEEVRPARQIVLNVPLTGARTTIGWSFRRIDG